jgi:hypothetical protein
VTARAPSIYDGLTATGRRGEGRNTGSEGRHAGFSMGSRCGPVVDLTARPGKSVAVSVCFFVEAATGGPRAARASICCDLTSPVGSAWIHAKHMESPPASGNSSGQDRESEIQEHRQEILGQLRMADRSFRHTDHDFGKIGVRPWVGIRRRVTSVIEKCQCAGQRRALVSIVEDAMATAYMAAIANGSCMAS